MQPASQPQAVAHSTHSGGVYTSPPSAGSLSHSANASSIRNEANRMFIVTMATIIGMLFISISTRALFPSTHAHFGAKTAAISIQSTGPGNIPADVVPPYMLENPEFPVKRGKTLDSKQLEFSL